MKPRIHRPQDAEPVIEFTDDADATAGNVLPALAALLIGLVRGEEEVKGLREPLPRRRKEKAK